MISDAILANLNPSQNAAVCSTANTLAILAGPGSGKTHTLTSRTAWLLAQGLQPCNVIVATFTVKAAREMKERIGKLIGNGMESKLILGTFHSVSRRYLARYGHLIGIRKDFGVADSADSLAIIKRIVKRGGFLIDPKVARSRVSGKKARGTGYTESTSKKASLKSIETQEFEKVYDEYEEALDRSNMLDFDDLLLRCVELLRTHPSCVSNVEAVLIDEFQDTNVVQFDLMRLFAAERRRITIVGDPDQSIYGFRAAEIRNYKRMLHQYPDTVTIALEENYRSSGAILLSALNVIRQDTSRVDKSLMPTHSVGTRPVLRKLFGAHKEADWIVTEIQRCIGLTGDLLDLDDFAVLVRSASLSRLVESALGKSGIAYRMVGGLRFYDRVEVKTLLDYLRVINQPDNNDAVARIINTPSRRIGDATVKALLEEADGAKVTLWQLVLGVVQGRRSTKTQLKKQKGLSLSEFVNIILTGRRKFSCRTEESETLVGLIKHVLEKTDYENWLKQHHDDSHGARWDNVQELITQAKDFQELISCGYEDEALPEIDGLGQEDNDDHLSRFLANVALASEVKKDDEGVATPQVTISTIHAAKGLEWPVVFIPAIYHGSIPHSRADDDDEERRLLYVAMTRAKALLYMSCPLHNSQGEQTSISPFITSNSVLKHLEPKGPSLGSSVVQSISQMLRRSCPSQQSIVKSSIGLQSWEDDRFPVEGDEQKCDRDLNWKVTHGGQNFNMGLPAPKRRRVELNRSTRNLSSSSAPGWKPTYTTTMAKSLKFSTSCTTTASGFISAGSHLQVLHDQSVDGAISEVQNSEEAHETSKKQPGGGSKVKGLKGQGTLFSFLGGSEPVPPQLPKRSRGVLQQAPISCSQTSATLPPNINEFHKSASNPSTAIDSLLANHRLKANSKGIKPQGGPIPLYQQRSDYIFLSSSPPRPLGSKSTTNESVAPKVDTLPSKPALVSLVRPPTSMHKTSLDILQSDGGAKKALGMRRSVNSASYGQRGTKFKPPMMRKPSG